MATLLKDAIRQVLVQTITINSTIFHGGPLNIAQDNTAIATKWDFL